MPGQPQFNADQNPFAQILAQMGPMGGQGASQPAPQQPAPRQQQIPGSTQQQTMMEQIPEQLQPGKEGTGSKFLLGAIQNIQGYISMATDPQKIRMLRQLINVFVSLLAQEQESAMSELGDAESTGEDMGEGGEPGMGMMGGMGGGMQ